MLLLFILLCIIFIFDNLMTKIKNNSDEIKVLLEQSGFQKSVNGENLYKLEFKDLMNYRIDNILMVCSLYDFYTIVEDGHLQEAIFNEYLELNLHYAPHITRVYSGLTALNALEEQNFDLIISTSRLGDMEIIEFSKKVKEINQDIPFVLLTSMSREISLQFSKDKIENIDKIFIWNGDRKIFLAIIKYFEDLKNAPIDCLKYGVMMILLVEDSPEYYSSFLPQIYIEVMNQTQKLIAERSNTAEKLLRQRARPKILHVQTYEEGMNLIKIYKNQLLGIITDLKF